MCFFCTARPRRSVRSCDEGTVGQEDESHPRDVALRSPAQLETLVSHHQMWRWPEAGAPGVPIPETAAGMGKEVVRCVDVCPFILFTTCSRAWRKRFLAASYFAEGTDFFLSESLEFLLLLCKSKKVPSSLVLWNIWALERMSLWVKSLKFLGLLYESKKTRSSLVL